MNLQNWQQRGGHYLSGIARLKEGSSLAAAEADLNAIAARAEKAYPEFQLRLGHHQQRASGIRSRQDSSR